MWPCAAVSGVVSVDGLAADLLAACGDGVSWRIQHWDGTSSRTLAHGAIDNGGATAFSGGDLAAVDMAAGDALVFSVGPRGEYSCDCTELAITVHR